MNQIDLSDFYNNGFGWICRHCELEHSDSAKTSGRSRLISEGEAESKNPVFSNIGLAKWSDLAQTTLICPTCGISEKADRH